MFVMPAEPMIAPMPRSGQILLGANSGQPNICVLARAAGKSRSRRPITRQLASTVSDNAKRADSASGKSRHVSKTAEETGNVMSQANTALERITPSSAKISNITLA